MRIKTQIILSRELLIEIDRFAGASRRSLFFEVAAKEKINSSRQKGITQFQVFKR